MSKNSINQKDIVRDSYVFYKSFYDAIKELSTNNQVVLYNAINEYALNDVIPELKGSAKSVFTLIKPQIDANKKRWLNGFKGGRPNQTITKNKPINNKKETKVKPNVNVNVNDNDNVNDNENVNGTYEKLSRI